MIFIVSFSRGKVNIQKLILLICLIIIKIIYINSLEINSIYPHCLLLSNKNLLIVHKTGINIYDSLENSLFDYNFANNGVLSSNVQGASISIFQETESAQSYIFILAKNILYIIPTLEGSFLVTEDLSQYLLDLLGYTFYYYTFLFYKLDNSVYYFLLFILVMKVLTMELF